MDEQLLNDLNLTHAFINTLRASYQGMYVYIAVLEQLAPTPDGQKDIQNAATSIDAANKLWADFKEHKPLVRWAERANPSVAMQSAWTMLTIARNQLRRTMHQLVTTSSVERLLADPDALRTRVAAVCQAAYARQHFIQGLVSYGEIMNREDVADRWRQHTLSCMTEVNEAHQHLERAKQMSGSPDEKAVAALLDDTLGLPALYGQRVNDINVLLAQYAGRMDYADVEIDEAEAAEWKARGFPPEEAGRWYQAGMTPDDVVEWLQAGVPDPVVVFNFLLRAFPATEAAAWLRAGFAARDAAPWRDAGFDPEQAADLRRHGSTSPLQSAAG